MAPLIFVDVAQDGPPGYIASQDFEKLTFVELIVR